MNISQKWNSQREDRDEEGVIPLINVVFLILNFFMIAGQIQKSDPVNVVPPQSINQAKSERQPDVVIVVGTAGEWFLNDEAIELAQVSARLEQLFDVSADPKRFSIQIKADASIEVNALAPLFTQIKRAGLTKVSLATQLHQG